jgi:hypothetical protein
MIIYRSMTALQVLGLEPKLWHFQQIKNYTFSLSMMD